MLSLSVLLLVQQSDAQFAAAGLVVGLLGLGTGAGMIVQGRLIDRWGQARILLPTVALQAMALIGLVLAVRAGAGTWLLGLLALIVGAAQPQVGASLRGLWPRLVRPGQRDIATALSSLLFEGPVVLGPLLLVGLLIVMGSAGAVLLCAVCFVAGTVIFTGSKASRSWRGEVRISRDVRGALASPAVRSIAWIGAAQGLITALLQVSAAGAAAHDGAASRAGFLYAALSAGGLIGTLLYGAHRWTGRPARRLVVFLILVAAATTGCAVAPSLPVLAGALFAVGASIGPVAIICLALVEDLTPPGTMIEAFTTVTAASLGASACGAALAGQIVDRANPAMAFFIAAGIAVATAALCGSRRHCLNQSTDHSRRAHA
jgi:MFS family permease